jgi:hypothetical protein
VAAFIAISAPSEDGDKNHPARNRKKRTGSPMLAKRFIVAAFAVVAVGLAPLAFSGPKDLFTDIQAVPSEFASN